MRTLKQIKEYKKQWALKNKASIAKRRHDWYVKYKNTKVKEYLEKNHEKVLLWKRASYQRCKDTYRKYWQTPKARHNAKIQKYKNRSILKKLEHHTDSEWRSLLSMFNGKCVDCGTKQKIEKDHIVPLSKGGSDLIENIIPRCRSCNASKGNRIVMHSKTYT